MRVLLFCWSADGVCLYLFCNVLYCVSVCRRVLCANVFLSIPDCVYVCDVHYRADVEGQGEEQCAVLCMCCVCLGFEW